jgi:uncharacterized membrane protein (DUF106 family)
MVISKKEISVKVHYHFQIGIQVLIVGVFLRRDRNMAPYAIHIKRMEEIIEYCNSIRDDMREMRKQKKKKEMR